jgi:hypothetical protein
VSHAPSTWNIGWRRLGAGSAGGFLILLAFFIGRDRADATEVAPRPAAVQQVAPAQPESLESVPPQRFRGRDRPPRGERFARPDERVPPSSRQGLPDAIPEPQAPSPATPSQPEGEQAS